MSDPNRNDDTATGLRDRAASTAAAARDSVEQTYRAARDGASRAYDSAAEGVSHAVDATRQGARSAARSTAETVDTAPLAVLVGGVAVGLVAGMLIPRSRREADLLAPVGQRLTETATAAAQAARVAGKDQLDAIGLNADTAKAQVSKLVDGALKAATEASSAAAAEVRGGSAAKSAPAPRPSTPGAEPSRPA